MAKKTTTGKTFKTIKFVIYCYEKSQRGREEGTMQMTDARHKSGTHPAPNFDSYDEIGPFIRRCMAERGAAGR